MEKLWVATGNAGKLKEFEMQLKERFELHHQGEINGFSPRPEDGQTFLANAQIKARTLASVKSGFWVLAEDSGLVVEGLNGLPGIHSARYAGPKASDSENIAKLLKMMQIRNVPNRNAHFHCSLVIITPQKEEHHFEGMMKGTIAPSPKGQMGFGYDPVFIPEGQNQTLAELGPGYKIQHSHRSRALAAFLKKMFPS